MFPVAPINHKSDTLHGDAESAHEKHGKEACETPPISVEERFKNVPEELWLSVFSFFKPSELTPVANTCKLFRRIAQDGGLQKIIHDNSLYQLDYTQPLDQDPQYFTGVKTSPINLVTALSNTCFITGYKNGLLQIWALRDDTWECEAILEEHKGSINTIVKLTNTSFASASKDLSLKIWHKKDGVWVVDTHFDFPEEINTLSAFSDKYFVSGSCTSGTIKNWKKINDKWECTHTFWAKALNTLLVLSNKSLVIQSNDDVEICNHDGSHRVCLPKDDFGLWGYSGPLIKLAKDRFVSSRQDCYESIRVSYNRDEDRYVAAVSIWKYDEKENIWAREERVEIGDDGPLIYQVMATQDGRLLVNDSHRTQHLINPLKNNFLWQSKNNKNTLPRGKYSTELLAMLPNGSIVSVKPENWTFEKVEVENKIYVSRFAIKRVAKQANETDKDSLDHVGMGPSANKH